MQCVISIYFYSAVHVTSSRRLIRTANIKRALRFEAWVPCAHIHWDTFTKFKPQNPGGVNEAAEDCTFPQRALCRSAGGLKYQSQRKQDNLPYPVCGCKTNNTNVRVACSLSPLAPWRQSQALPSGSQRAGLRFPNKSVWPAKRHVRRFPSNAAAAFHVAARSVMVPDTLPPSALSCLPFS